MVGMMGRTSSAPIYDNRFNVDKVQGLWSGILTYTSLVLHQINVETRVKAFFRWLEIVLINIFEINSTVTAVWNTRETVDMYKAWTPINASHWLSIPLKYLQIKLAGQIEVFMFLFYCEKS